MQIATSNWNSAYFTIIPLSKQKELEPIYEELKQFSKVYFEEWESIALEKLYRGRQEAIHLSRDKKGRKWSFGVELNKKGGAYILTKTNIASGEESSVCWAFDMRNGRPMAHRKVTIKETPLKGMKARATVQQMEIHKDMQGSQVPELMHSCEIATKKHYKKYSSLMEYCNKGDLMEYIGDDEEGFVKDLEATPIAPHTPFWQPIKDVFFTLTDLHKRGFLHCDIKMENIFLYVDEKGVLRAKLGDFGFVCKTSDIVQTGNYSRGTPPYYPPEIAKQFEIDGEPGSDKSNKSLVASSKRDEWAMGIILSYLNMGNIEFLVADDEKLQEKIGKYLLDLSRLEDSQVLKFFERAEFPLKEINCRLLSIDPAKRPSPAECLQMMEEIELKMAKNS